MGSWIVRYGKLDGILLAGTKHQGSKHTQRLPRFRTLSGGCQGTKNGYGSDHEM